MHQFHSLHAVIICKPGTLPGEVMTELGPLVQARGWSQEQIFDPTLPMDDSVKAKMTGQFVDRISIYSHGRVPEDFLDVVQQTAHQLTDFVVAGCFDLYFPDSADPAGYHHVIWYGAPQEIEHAKQRAAILAVHSTLLAAGVGSEVVAGLNAIGRLFNIASAAQPPAVTGGAVNDLSALIAALAFVFGDQTVEIRTLGMQGIARGGREPIYGEAVSTARANGALHAVRLPHTRGAWYCFNGDGKLVCHLVPQHVGLKFLPADAAE